MARQQVLILAVLAIFLACVHSNSSSSSGSENRILQSAENSAFHQIFPHDLTRRSIRISDGPRRHRHHHGGSDSGRPIRTPNVTIDANEVFPTLGFKVKAQFQLFTSTVKRLGSVGSVLKLC